MHTSNRGKKPWAGLPGNCGRSLLRILVRLLGDEPQSVPPHLSIFDFPLTGKEAKMTIQEKRNQIAARMNAAYLRYDYAGIDEEGVALRCLDVVILSKHE